MKKGIYSIILISLCFFCYNGSGLDITASGGWSEIIDKDDLISGAGSDLKSTYESISNATVLAISGCTSDSDKWRVDVKRVDNNWHNNFNLFVRRTSDGTGGGSISGGASYISIGTTDSEFFSGAGNRNDINVRFKLDGVSVQIPPNSYTTTVVFTVVDESD